MGSQPCCTEYRTSQNDIILNSKERYLHAVFNEQKENKIMKLIYWILMILPGIVFFLDDFGEYTLPLRVFGIALILIALADMAMNKDMSQYICKIIYFPIFLIIWVVKIKADRKKANLRASLAFQLRSLRRS